jgi:TM2 domain-containing membrane protein YozV
MDRRAFEQHILDLVHRFGVRHLTTKRVAAEFGISAEEAERHLDGLVTVGTLELDTDDEGNLFYYVPGQDDGGVFAGNRDVQVNQSGTAPYSQPQPGPQQPPQGGGYGPQHGQQGGGYPNRQNTAPQYPNGAYGNGQQQPSGPWPQQQQGPYGPYQGRGPQTGGPHQQNQQGGPTGTAPYQQGYGQNYPVPYQQNQYPAQLHQRSEKNPTTAALLSFFPGAGQLYNGQFGKAFFFFFLTTFFYMMPPFGFLMGMLPHAWSVLDAAASARRQNYGMLPP